MFPVLKEIKDLLHFIHYECFDWKFEYGDNSPLNKVILVLLLFAVAELFWFYVLAVYTSVLNLIYGIYSTMNLKTRVYKQIYAYTNFPRS